MSVTVWSQSLLSDRRARQSAATLSECRLLIDLFTVSGSLLRLPIALAVHVVNCLTISWAFKLFPPSCFLLDTVWGGSRKRRWLKNCCKKCAIDRMFKVWRSVCLWLCGPVSPDILRGVTSVSLLCLSYSRILGFTASYNVWQPSLHCCVNLPLPDAAASLDSRRTRQLLHTQ